MPTKTEVLLSPAGAFANPMTTPGDIITGGAAGAATRLPIATQAGAVLGESSGAVAYVGGKVNGEVYLTAGTTAITSAQNTKVSWTGETYNNGSVHAIGLNPTRLTAPIAGMYHFDAYLYLASGGGSSVNMQCFKNGAANSFLFSTSLTDYSGVGRVLEQHFQLPMAAGDYVEFSIFQGSGGPINLLGGVTDGSSGNQATVCRAQMALLVAQ